MIPLLAPKPLSEFTPEEYKAYVRALYKERTVRKAKPKRKKLKDYKVKGSLLKNGKISITTTRPIKYLTEVEFREISLTLGRGENEVFIAAKAKGLQIMSHEEAEQIRKDIEEIPF